jgi:hypothetical protein
MTISCTTRDIVCNNSRIKAAVTLTCVIAVFVLMNTTCYTCGSKKLIAMSRKK